MGEQIDDLAPFDPEEFARALTGAELDERHLQEVEVLFDERPTFLFRVGPEDPLSQGIVDQFEAVPIVVGVDRVVQQLNGNPLFGAVDQPPPVDYPADFY